MNDGLYPGLAGIAAALSSPTRLRALTLLFQAPRSIDALARMLGESEANTAAHMKSLRNAGLVRAERRGKHVVLEPSDECVLGLFLALREAGERLHAEIRLLDDGTDTSASELSPEQLSELSVGRSLMLVDLRPEPEYARGHLPGARSMPLETLPQRIGELPSRRRILAYCRGKYCPNARLGVARLRSSGLKAERLRFGVPEWRARGLAVER